MRIIGGSFKSRRFEPPKRFEGRPTTDFAREALFNILNNEVDFEGLKVLDLYAGTGSVSYEFISRGAEEVVSVDSQTTALRFIREMSEKWEMDGIWVEKNDCLAFLESVRQPFDVIFADPPYDSNDFERVHALAFRKNALSEDGILVIEHGQGTDLSKLQGFDRCKAYGQVHFSFFYSDFS